MKIVLLFFIVTLAACSSVYHKKEGWVPEGYTDEKIEEALYFVSFQTYRRLEWPEIKAYALLRAAEIGKLNGYQYFAVDNLQQQEQIEIQQNKQVDGVVIGASSKYGSAEVTGAVIPAFTSEHKIRTVSFNARYVQQQSESDYEVDAILTVMRE